MYFYRIHLLYYILNGADWEKWRNRRKPVSVPQYPTQIAHGLL